MNESLTSFSFSGLSLFKSCPKAFEYKYIKKLTEAFSGIEAHMGSSVHEALEWAYTQRSLNLEPSLENTLDKYNEAWRKGDFNSIKIVKDDRSKEDYYNDGRNFLLKYMKEIFPSDDTITLYLEHRFELELAENTIYRGVIDRIAKKNDGTIRITDYKTGKVDHPLDTLQLPSYAMYIFHHNIDAEIEICYEDLREGRTIAVSIPRKDARRIKEELLEEIRIIRNTPPSEFVTKPSTLCGWCGYNPICENPHESVRPGMNYISSVTKLSHSSSDTPIEYEEACPLCGSPLKQKKGKFGSFFGCSDYPNCKYTRNIGPDPRNAANDPNIEGKDVCPECGGLLKQRKGKYGSFYGCTNYPQCRFTRPIPS